MIYLRSSGCIIRAELENAVAFLGAFSNSSSAKENRNFSLGPSSELVNHNVPPSGRHCRCFSGPRQGVVFLGRAELKAPRSSTVSAVLCAVLSWCLMLWRALPSGTIPTVMGQQKTATSILSMAAFLS